MGKINGSNKNVKCSYNGCNTTAKYSVEWHETHETDIGRERQMVESYFSCSNHKHLVNRLEYAFDSFGQPNFVWDLSRKENRPDLVRMLKKSLALA